ncbi:MAG: hypothetical protein A2189_09405 [Paenibacillus sp. RIFOXYA1_FULL_44_5]|nr:MAG: hypothetical protein A2189_09405 [Paenibacillus sp. RIFOXYA1_FULL_44_5]
MQFPESRVVLMAGSIARGDAVAGAGSDIDVIIVDDSQELPFKKSEWFEERLMESFIVTRRSLRYFFEQSKQNALPSMLRMIIDGQIIRDDGTVLHLKQAAVRWMEHGPAEWSFDEMNQIRYEISEYLDDLHQNRPFGENVFIMSRLCTLLPQFILRTRDKWTGDGKWQYRMLKQADEELSKRFVLALQELFQTQNPGMLVQLAEELLEPYGGRLYEGVFYSSFSE